MDQFVADIQGEERLIAVLKGVIASGPEKAQLFDEIGFNLVENARLRMSAGVSPDGIAWPPSIRAMEQGGKTLIDTGVLRNSLTHNVMADGVEYGTNVPYAAPLHYGATIRAVNSPFLVFKIGNRYSKKKEVTLPKREFIGISREDELMVQDVFNEFLLRVTR